MRWPWRYWEDADARRARHAAERAARVLEEEQQRLAEAAELAERLARHRQRNRFAEAMRVAFGGRPGTPQ